MRLIGGFALLVLVSALLAFWWFGIYSDLVWLAAQEQHQVQTSLARAISRVRAGDGWAVFAVLGACLAYGFIHAAGPGHGKVVVGAAALSSGATAWKMSAIALASSLGQAVSALVLVYGGFIVFEFTARQATAAADTFLAPLSFAIIGGIGLFLIWRGLRRLLQSKQGDFHDHGHVHGPDCDHRHGPTQDEVAGLQGWRPTLALIFGIAIRPCTGAIFLLVICWQAGLISLGIAGAFTMASGTAAFTILVAAVAVSARGASLLALENSKAAQIAIPLLQMFGGGLVLALAAVMLAASGQSGG